MAPSPVLLRHLLPDEVGYGRSEQGDFSMTFTGRLNLVVAYAALAFVGAIILGLF